MTAEQAEQEARRQYIDARLKMGRITMVKLLKKCHYEADPTWTPEELADLLWALVGKAEWRVRQKMARSGTAQPAASRTRSGWRETTRRAER